RGRRRRLRERRHPVVNRVTGARDGRRAPHRDRSPPGCPPPDLPSPRLTMTTPIRLVIADDHLLFRQGLRLLLKSEPEVTIVGETDRADELPTLLARTPCDQLLLDLQMERNRS